MASLTRLPAQAGGGGMAPQSAPGPERRTLSLQRARLFALRATSRACALDVHCACTPAGPSAASAIAAATSEARWGLMAHIRAGANRARGGRRVTLRGKKMVRHAPPSREALSE